MAEQPFTGTLTPGTKLGKYDIREQVAVGGMAVVYKAYDPTLDRHVAVKQIAPHLVQDPRFIERFRTEAQTLARLSTSQPNIVTVHELIEQAGQLFLVMEYVEGTTLRSMMDRGPVPIQTGLGVLLATALGLRAMHAQGIVHRDLTPLNLMMAKDGAVKITDFGLIGHSGGRTSLPMGTTKYMAPEMFAGAPVDSRADLYSLGIIAYEMFLGPDKFAEVFRDVLRDERAQQVRWMHWHANPALRAPALKDLQPGIPPLVSKIVERLMEKDASRRFASADQLVRWLRRIFVMYVQGKSVSVTDSEVIEKEMDAEAITATAAAARPAAPATSAAPTAAETSEKTAPIPQPKWTWKRAAFWAAVVAGPLVLIGVALLLFSYRGEQRRLDTARQAQRLADEQFHTKDYGGAAAAYLKIAQDFPDLKGVALYAMQRAMMARAEETLQKKDWNAADDYAGRAERSYEAPPEWVNDFRTRFNKGRQVEQELASADLALKNGDFEKAITILSDLSAQSPNLVLAGDVKLNDYIAEVRDKMEMREYRRLVEEGNEALRKKDIETAAERFYRARKIRETPEILDQIKKVENDKKIAQWFAGAKKAAAGSKWDEAYSLYAQIYNLMPSDANKTEMNHAKAEGLAAKAAPLAASGLVKEALELYRQVLQFDPEHAAALAFIQQRGRQEQLDGFIKAGDEATAKGEWDSAVNSYSLALPLVDPADAGTKQRIETQITEARYRAAMAKAREALAQDRFDEATERAEEAKTHNDTQEVTDFLVQVDTRRRYHEHLDLGKELLSQGSYVKALAEFEATRKIEETGEVRDLLVETQYRLNLAKGKSLLADGKFREAAAMFRVTQRYKDTPEVQAYIQQAEEQALKAQGGGGGGGGG